MSEKRYVPRGVPLTPREREILTLTIEECSEVIHAASKLIRFGRGDVTPGQELPNDVVLAHEVGDLTCLLQLAVDAGLIKAASVETGARTKRARLRVYTEHMP